jgi:hypothetical protein
MTHQPASSKSRRAGRRIPRTRGALTALGGLTVLLTAAIGLAPAASASTPPLPPGPVPPPPPSTATSAHLPLWAVVAIVAATIVLSIATTLITLAVEHMHRARHTSAVAGRPPVRRGRPDRPRIRVQQEFNEPSTHFAEAHLKSPGDRAQAKTARAS